MARWTVICGMAAAMLGGCVTTTGPQAKMYDANYSIFSADDRARIQHSARQEWGKAIVALLEEGVAERLQHGMAVPAEEAGHFHHYFCPEHKRQLDFDMARPSEHWCEECQAYLTGERYDRASLWFVHAMNKQFLQECTLLHIVTGEQRYLHLIRDLLLDYAAKYPNYELHGHNMEPSPPYAGKMFSQSLDEASWIGPVAAAFIEARPIMTPEEIASVEEGLLRQSAGVILRNRAGGNWQVWHNAGLAQIAIALKDDDLLDTALHDPEHGYDHMMATGINADGWWLEGSPCYHFYPLRAMVETAEAARCRGIDLWDDRLRAAFASPLHSLLGDLSFPAHNDGWHTLFCKQAPLYETAALRYGNPLLKDALARAYTVTPRESWTALLNGEPIEPNATPLELGSYLYPDTGVALLRDGVRTAVLKFGPHGGGHGHPDKLSIIVHDGEQQILPDLGTPGYGVPDFTRWYKHTVSHNTVVVDEKDQAPATGKLLSFAPAGDGGTVVATCDTAYEGVKLQRRLRMFGGQLSDAFFATSESEHTYDYVMLLPEPVPLPDGAAPVSLGQGAGYGRIENARQWRPRDGRLQMDFGQATLQVIARGATSFIQGTAPGMPPNRFKEDDTLETRHVLLIRTQGAVMRVDAVWQFERQPGE